MASIKQSLPKFDWVFRETEPERAGRVARSLSTEMGISKLLARVLVARGFDTKETARDFIKPSENQILHPDAIPGMGAAVDRLIQAVRGRESVMVHGDYDVDGISGAVMVHDTLKKLGCVSRIFLPRRDLHGFGLAQEAVKKAIDGKIGLIVTVDCGISSAESVKLARDAGIDVIVTDHHPIPEKIPGDCLIVHPELDGVYPGGKLVGAAVAYKLVLSLLEKLGEDFEEAKYRLLPMVAMATVADVVPLLGENRALVSIGLPLFSETKIPGLQVLWHGTRRNDAAYPTARDIAFGIAPLLNAAGRMGDPFPSAKLLLAPDTDTAWEYYRKLDRLNNERKRIMNTITGRLMRLPDVAWTASNNKILALVDQNCSPGLAGLAAARVAEQTGRPTIILVPTEDSDGLLYRGSMRTAQDVDLMNLVESAVPHADKIGGHRGALGISVKPEKLDDFINSAREISFEQAPRTLELDFRLEESPETSEEILGLDVTGPWGVGNPPPTFAFGPVRIGNTRAVGKQLEHIQVNFEERSGTVIKSIGFFLAGHLNGMDSVGKDADAAGQFVLNNWQGKSSIEFQIEDLHLR